MVRRAEWKPRREDAWRGLSTFVLRFTIFITFVFVGLLLGFWAGYGWIAFGAAAAWFGFSGWRPNSSARHGKELARIAPWPPPPGAFPARIVYCHDIDPIAEDEAIVAFGDGWMTVEGIRASFSFRPQDVRIVYAEGNGCDLWLSETERVEIRPFDALEVGDDSTGSLRNRFEIALVRWADEGAPSAKEAQVVLPPALKSVDQPRLRTFWTGAAGMAALWIGAFQLVMVFHRVLSPGWMSVFGFGLGMLAVVVQRTVQHRQFARSRPPSLRSFR